MLSRARATFSDIPLGSVVVAAGASYMLLAAWAMMHVSYDVWGALIAAPIIGMLATPLVMFILRGEPRPLVRIAMLGMVVKLGGTLARYWVAVDAYGGASDSTEYHRLGKLIAGDAHDGAITVVGLVPHTQGTKFISQLTGFVYTFAGSSKLAGFLWFAVFGYFGVVLSVKAACIAVPGLAKARYAMLCFLAPSIVFWPSAIGKEAWMSLCLGAVAMGAARLFRGGNVMRALLWIGVGAGGAAMVRPHMAAIWLGAIVLTIVWAVISGRVGPNRGNRRIVLGVVALVALAALAVVAEVTLRYLAPPNEGETASVTDQVSDIFDLTTRRTSGGGSELDPIVISGPLDYPVAVVRTLTRPLLNEASSVATLLPAVEMTFIVALALLSWRRLLSVPRYMRRTPFVLYCALVCIMFGLAFATLANLAILVRQRSLVMPAMFVLLCLPVWSPARGTSTPQRPADQRRMALR